MLAGPIDPAEALRFEDLNDFLNPGYLPREIGYCLLPDGAGYVSSHIKMPGVTTEMFDWWFAWHALEPLRYKIWDPEDHFDLQISGDDRKRLLDTSIPIRERNWGCTHQVVEDVGMGRANIPIRFQSPEEFGFDMQRFKSPYAETAVCANSTMCHFVRAIEGGIELRTRFWFGYTLENGKPVRRHDFRVPEQQMRALNLHCIKEYTHLARILPVIHAEEHERGNQ